MLVIKCSQICTLFMRTVIPKLPGIPFEIQHKFPYFFRIYYSPQPRICCGPLRPQGLETQLKGGGYKNG